MAGARLRDGNPFITDLGDSNRPDKLAERFSELYDNEWSDVMEKMPVNESEEHKVGILLNILKVSYYIIIWHMFFFSRKYLHTHVSVLLLILHLTITFSTKNYICQSQFKLNWATLIYLANALKSIR